MGKIRTVLVDDSQAINWVNEQLINLVKEFEVVNVFTDPKKAIDYIREKGCDLLILDLQMPEINGEQFLIELNKTRKLGKPFVAVLTDFSKRSLTRDKLGADDYLRKPLEIEDLEEISYKLR